MVTLPFPITFRVSGNKTLLYKLAFTKNMSVAMFLQNDIMLLVDLVTISK